jgi:hypothetical protein
MSSKASFSIGGLKSVAGRTKQKMLQKMGKVDETVDIAFNQEFEKLMSQKKMMKKMIKNIKEYGKALRSTLSQTIPPSRYSGTELTSCSLSSDQHLPHGPWRGRGDLLRAYQPALPSQLEEPANHLRGRRLPTEPGTHPTNLYLELKFNLYGSQMNVSS